MANHPINQLKPKNQKPQKHQKFVTPIRKTVGK